jgi:hypothetical protein
MKRRRSALAGKKAVVFVERNGCGIRIEDVPALESAAVLADLLSAFRELTSHYEELTVDLTPVPGGTPVDGDASDFGARKRVGFIR